VPLHLALCISLLWYLRFGEGNARNVLEGMRDADLEAALTTTIDNINNPKAQRSEFDNSPSSIVQLRVKRDLETRYKEFASAYIQQRLLEAAYQQSKHDVLTYMGMAGAAPGTTDFSSARGSAWESVSHIILREGGDFMVRELHGAGGTYNVTLPASPLVQPFCNISDISGALDGVYFQPQSERYPAIDSARQPSHLYQITRSPSKPGPDPTALLHALRQLKDADSPVLYYVVPEFRSAGFKAARVNETSLGEDDLRLVQNLKQAVLSIPDDAWQRFAALVKPVEEELQKAQDPQSAD
jgi:hypothetical protein